MFHSLDPFFTISKLGPCLRAVEEDGGDKRLLQLEQACEAVNPVSIAVTAEAILM